MKSLRERLLMRLPARRMAAATVIFGLAGWTARHMNAESAPYAIRVLYVIEWRISASCATVL